MRIYTKPAEYLHDDEYYWNFKYDPNDVLISDSEIKQTVKDMPHRHHLFKNKKGVLHLDLLLQKGANLNNIDEFFDRFFSIVQKEYELDEITIKFGERELGEQTVRYLLDGSQLGNLVKLQETAQKHGINLYFKEFEDCESQSRWTLLDVLKANNSIDDLANQIEENQLSPFEALLFICTWAQKNIKYYSNSSDLERLNTIVSAFKNKNISCVGFSQFVTAVANRLSPKYRAENNALIARKSIGVSYGKGNGSFSPNHSQSKFYVKDQKYDIDGEVIADVLGTVKSGAIRETDLEDIKLLTFTPISTFSEIVCSNEEYYIYNDVETTRISVVDRVQRGLSQIVTKEERDENDKISLALEHKGSISNCYKEAYKKIIPLVFPEAKPGDLIAPVLDEEMNFNQTIDVARGRNRELWEDWLKKNPNPSSDDEEKAQ